MLRWVRGASLVAVAVSIVATTSPTQAAHHLWKFAQVFSNASGSVQFIQLQCPEAGENSIGAFGITSNGGHPFSFATDLPSGSSTANSWVLVATSNFASQPGAIMPDYILPVSNFFSTGGDTLTYANGADTWTFGTVPTDGVHSLMRSGATATNALTNFVGKTGSVNLASPMPAVPRIAIAVLVGAMLLAGSGLLRRARSTPAV
jgi:hypothetical protein